MWFTPGSMLLTCMVNYNTDVCQLFSYGTLLYSFRSYVIVIIE